MQNTNEIPTPDKVVGVIQSFHGHDYKWIFTKDEVRRQFAEYGIDLSLDKMSVEDILWPIGGSNSSATTFITFNTEQEIREFLTSPYYCECEDPSLVDIAEYLCDISTDNDGQITDQFLKKFGYTAKDCSFTDDLYGHQASADEMIGALKEAGYEGNIDYDNPYYGFSCDVRYSELCKLYESVTGNLLAEA